MRHTELRRLLALWGIVAAVGLVVLMMALAEPFQPDSFGPGHDARAYWAAPLAEPYEPGSVGHESAYLYSPAFLVALSPLRALPWPLFVGAWTVLLLVVLFWLARPMLFLPLLLLALPEIWGGNITILIAAAVVVGLSRPWAWAFPLLTKLTPGVGVLWFAARREWLHMAIAIAVTVGIIGAVALVTPGLWSDWFQLLVSSTGSSTVPGSVPVPLVLRLPLALAVIVYAARRDQRWLLPVGVLLAMPVIWWGSLALLTASVALKRESIEGGLDRLIGAAGDAFERRQATRAAVSSS